MLFVKVVRKIAVTVEEIEIIVRTKVAEALGELRSLQAELKRTGQADKILSYAKAAAPTVVKAAAAMKQPSVEIQKAAAAAADKYGDLDKIIQRVEERAKKASEQIGKTSVPNQSNSPPARKTAVLTPTDSLENYLNDKISYNDLMNSFNAADTAKPPGVGEQSQQMSRYQKALEQATAVLKKFGPVGQAAARKVSVATGQATDETEKYEDQVDKSTSKAKGSFSSLAKHIKRIFVSTVLYSGMRKLFSFLGGGIREAVSAPETENLFRVALGNLSDDAEDFAVKMKNNLGIDEYVSKKMIGTFQQIGTAVGVASNTAFGMSKSMTMLANDMASLYNVDPEQAYENLQSALTGQGRAVRKYGFVITEQTVKEAAYRHGLVKTGQELTEQQKYVARGIALMEQSKNAQGDMARTLGNIQNQIRILKQNIIAAKRSIGQAFIPTIQAALPWLNAFAVLLQRAGVALARWSYARHGMNYDEEMAKQKKVINGYNGIAAAEDNAGESAEKAGKKAQRSLLPFDQINRLQSPDKGSDSSSSGGSAPYDPGWDYEPDLSGVTAFEDEIAILEEEINKLFPAVLAIGSAFAAWKIGKRIFRGLESILGVKGLRGVANELKAIARIVVSVIKAHKSIIGKISAISAAILVCVVRFRELYKESKYFRKGLEVIGKAFAPIWQTFKNGAKAAYDWTVNKFKGLYNYIFPEEIRNKISKALKSIDADFGDVLITAAGVAALFIPGGKVVGAILLGFEAITIAIRGIGYLADGGLEELKTKFFAWWNDVTARYNQTIAPVFTKRYWDDKFSSVTESASEKLNEAKSIALSWWSDTEKWFSDNIAPKFTKKYWQDLYSSIVQSAKEKLSETKTEVYSWWGGIVKWFNDNISPKFTTKYWKDKFSSIVSSAREKLSELKRIFESWSAKIKTPHMSWDSKNGYQATGAVKAVLETLNLPTVIPKLRVKWMAMGGIVKKRQLIGAGEAGAEAIVPLERNLGWIKNLAKHIVSELESYASIPTVTTSQFELPENRLQYQPRGLTSGNIPTSFNNPDDRHLRRITFLLERILATLKEQDFSFAIGDDEIYRSAVRGGRRETLATGKPAFGL